MLCYLNGTNNEGRNRSRRPAFVNYYKPNIKIDKQQLTSQK